MNSRLLVASAVVIRSLSLKLGKARIMVSKKKKKNPHKLDREKARTIIYCCIKQRNQLNRCIDTCANTHIIKTENKHTENRHTYTTYINHYSVNI